MGKMCAAMFFGQRLLGLDAYLLIRRVDTFEPVFVVLVESLRGGLFWTATHIS